MAGGDALFTMESAIDGYHFNQNIWNSRVGERLECHCKDDDIHDMYTVAIIKSGTRVVGHLPRLICTLCNHFIENHGTITCIVTGSHRFSANLERSGLEIPVKLSFKGDDKIIDKVREQYP